MVSFVHAASACGAVSLSFLALPALAEDHRDVPRAITTLQADDLYGDRMLGIDQILRFDARAVTDGGLSFGGIVEFDSVLRDGVAGDTLSRISLHALDRIEVLQGATVGFDLGVTHYRNGEERTTFSGGFLLEPVSDLRFVIGAPRPVSELFSGRPFVRADAVLESSAFGFYQSDIGGAMDHADPFEIVGVSALYFLPRGTLGASYHYHTGFDESLWSVGGEYQFPALRISASLEGGENIDDPILRAGIAGAFNDRFTYRFDLFHQGGAFENSGLYAQAGYRVTPQIEIGLAALCEDFDWGGSSAVGLYGHWDILDGGDIGSLPDAGLALRASAAETDAGIRTVNLGLSFRF